MDSQVFDLYGSNVDPANANGFGDGSASNLTNMAVNLAFAGIDQIFQMFSENRQTIINDDSTYGDTIVAKDNDNFFGYSSFEAETGIMVQTTDAALTPAYDFLSHNFAEGVDIGGPGSLEDANGELNLDQFNIYVAPLSEQTQSQGENSVVSFSPSMAGGYSGNYIEIGAGTGQTLQGAGQAQQHGGTAAILCSRTRRPGRGQAGYGSPAQRYARTRRAFQSDGWQRRPLGHAPEPRLSQNRPPRIHRDESYSVRQRSDQDGRQPLRPARL